MRAISLDGSKRLALGATTTLRELALEALAPRALRQAARARPKRWRQDVVEPHVAGILRELRGDAPETLGVLARRASRAAFSIS